MRSKGKIKLNDIDESKDSLDEIVNFYYNMPKLSERTNINHLVDMGQKLSLKEALFENGKYFSDKPFFTSLGTTTLTYLPSLISDKRNNYQTITHGLDEMFYTYLLEVIGITVLRDYVFKKRKKLKPEGLKKENIFSKVKYAIANNPQIVGVVGAIATSGFFLYFSSDNPSNNFDADFMRSVAFLGYALGHITAELARANEIVKRGFEKVKKKKEERTLGNLVKKIYNGILENPGKIATTIGVGSFIYDVSQIQFSKIVDWNYFVPYLITKTPEPLFLASATYAGLTAASWLLHTNSLNLMKDSLLSRVNQLTKNYDQSILHQKKIVEIPTSSTNEIKNRMRLGDLYMKNKMVGEALTEYSTAMSLVGDDTRIHTDPLDFLSSVFKKLLIFDYALLRTIPLTTKLWFTNQLSGSIVKGEENLDENDREDHKTLNYYIDPSNTLKNAMNCIKIRKLDMADEFFRHLIVRFPNDIEMHLLYGRFLDVVGDDVLAKEEYDLSLSLLLENVTSEEDFERIGISKNEVLEYNAGKFLNSTLIFKRSSDGESIEDEYNATKLIREEFGSKIVNPLTKLKHKELHYLIMERVGGKTLFEEMLN